MSRLLIVTIALACAACTPPASAPPAAFASVESAGPVAPLPRGATIGPDGYATIIDVPPAPFTPTVPGEPPPMTADQRAGHEQFARAARFQNEVMAEVQALQDRLRSREKGNFVDLYMENEGEPHVVFRFLREPERTLAKYTRDRRFRAAKADYTNEQLAAALDFMMKTFAEDRVIMGGGYGNKENRAVIDLLVPESEFRALVARKGVAIPDSVKLNFAEGPPAAAVNRPIPAHIAPLVRIFPRSDRPVGIVNSIDSRAKIVLRDGCFRSPDNGDALVLFPMGANLFIDRENYLAFGSGEAPGYARVGEVVIFAGSIGEVTAPELVRPIHAACGTGKVIAVTELRSAAADAAQSAVHQNAQALRNFRESYGLSEPAARTALERCIANSGTPFCPMTPPSPPVSRQSDCPAGTRLSYGMCRTPEGYIRPIPDWLKDLAGS